MTQTGCSDKGTDVPIAPDSGFILLAALWLLALLSVLSLWLADVVHLDTIARDRINEKIRQQLLVDGFAHVLVQTIAARRTTPLNVTGQAISCTLSGEDAGVQIHDVAGLIDVNAAPRIVLKTLIAAVGASPEIADTLSAAIIDFRDGDGIQTPGGAEVDQYQAAGRPFGPKNAPFETVAELDQVLGLTPELYTRLTPWLTVYSHRPSANWTAAPTQLLQAFQRTDQDNFLVTNVDSNSDLGGKILDIVVAVQGQDGVAAVRHAVVEFDARKEKEFVFREWDLGSSSVPTAVKPSPSQNDCLLLFE